MTARHDKVAAVDQAIAEVRAALDKGCTCGKTNHDLRGFDIDAYHDENDCRLCAALAALRVLADAVGELRAKIAEAEAWLANETSRRVAAEAERDRAQREADIQLGEKLAAQMTLKAVCDVLNLPMVSLGNGWTEATPKILARIETIVDEADRGFRERDAAELRAVDMEKALRELVDAVRVLDVMLREPAAEGLMSAEDYRAYLQGAWLGVDEKVEQARAALSARNRTTCQPTPSRP